MVSFGLPLLSSWLIYFKFYFSNDFSFPPLSNFLPLILASPPPLKGSPGALFLTQHWSPRKNATTELPSSFFSHSHRAGKVSQCSWSGSFGDLLVSHQEHTVTATALWRHVVTCSSPAELVGNDRTAEMSPQLRSQQHPDGQEELWVGRSFFPESPWLAAAGWAWRSPVGPGFSISFLPVSVQGQSVCPWAEEQRARTRACGQGRRKGGE